jgi:hypothetical protein
MYNWKDTRNYRRFRDENGNVIANIIYVDGEEVAVSDEVYEAYDAIVTPVSEAVTNTAIASVLFIIAWDAV